MNHGKRKGRQVKSGNLYLPKWNQTNALENFRNQKHDKYCHGKQKKVKRIVVNSENKPKIGKRSHKEHPDKQGGSLKWVIIIMELGNLHGKWKRQEKNPDKQGRTLKTASRKWKRCSKNLKWKGKRYNPDKQGRILKTASRMWNRCHTKNPDKQGGYLKDESAAKPGKSLIKWKRNYVIYGMWMRGKGKFGKWKGRYNPDKQGKIIKSALGRWKRCFKKLKWKWKRWQNPDKQGRVLKTALRKWKRCSKKNPDQQGRILKTMYRGWKRLYNPDEQGKILKTAFRRWKRCNKNPDKQGRILKTALKRWKRCSRRMLFKWKRHNVKHGKWKRASKKSKCKWKVCHNPDKQGRILKTALRRWKRCRNKNPDKQGRILKTALRRWKRCSRRTLVKWKRHDMKYGKWKRWKRKSGKRKGRYNPDKQGRILKTVYRRGRRSSKKFLKWKPE